MENLERRFIDKSDAEFRTSESEDSRIIEGYAAKFNSRSKLILENGKLFYESLERGAFDDALSNVNLDVMFVLNHDRGKLMARSVSGTLTLSADEKGLFYRAIIPNGVSYAEDAYALIKRGDLFANSFAFSVAPQDVEWGKDENGTRTRTIKRVSGLYDVSLVATPAYNDTTVAARSLEEVEKSEVIVKEEPKIYKSTESYKRRLKILNLKNN